MQVQVQVVEARMVLMARIQRVVEVEEQREMNGRMHYGLLVLLAMVHDHWLKLWAAAVPVPAVLLGHRSDMDHSRHRRLVCSVVEVL